MSTRPARSMGTTRRPSYRERKEARFAKRVQTWEQRLAGPPPPMQLHRAVITIGLMVLALLLAWMIAFG